MVRFNIFKYSGGIAFLLTLAFASCKNDIVDVTREEAQITVLLNNVISSFTAYSLVDNEMYSTETQTSKIVVKAFVYDDSGQLINSLTREISDYSQNSVSFSTAISGSNPQIVCLTYAAFTDSQGTTYDAYKISGEKLISTLKIENFYASFVERIPWQVLGGAIKTVGIGSEEISIDVKPLGALAYINWKGIHAHDGEANAPDRYAYMQKYNDVAMVKEGNFVYSSSLPVSYYFLADVFPAKHPTYNHIYSIRFMFPGNVESYAYGSYSPSNYSNDDDEVETKRSESRTIQVEAGKQYVFRMLCNDYTIDDYEGIIDD